jgi:ribonuclease R
MIISPTGKIIKSEFFNGLMHSKARLTYHQVQAILDGNKAQQQKHQAILPMLQTLHHVYKILLQARQKRGALDLDTVETQIVFGANRKIEKIIPTKRVDSHRLIEECMLAANVAVAKFLSAQEKISVLYRVHNGPKAERLTNLRQFLAELSLSLPGKDKPTPKDYANLLEKIRDRSDAHLIQTMLLRSLSQAIYSPENAGHFGLAYTEYTHFTSPIRRYPDLMIHRAIKQMIAKKNKNAIYPYSEQQVIQLGEHCSLTERRADDATRDAVLSLKCQFLKDKVGKEFAGIVSHVASFGLFVELQDIYVEGLIHVTSLKNDYYLFDAAQQRLQGERTGQSFRLGDKLTVLVARVDIDQKRIDFELIAAPVKSKKKKLKKDDEKKVVKKRKKA